MVRALLMAACCTALVACASGSQKPASSAPPGALGPPGAASSAGESPLPASPHDQIEQLAQQIDTARVQLELPAPTAEAIGAAPAQPMGAVPAAQDPKCRPAPTDTCKTSCELSDSICDNADKICKLAAELAGDGWAANKCATANTTCEASRTKCCGCQ